MALFQKVFTLPTDLYLTSLALGGVGLVAMTFSGFGRHGQHGSHSSSHGHGHGGHAHGTGSHGHTGTHVSSLGARATSAGTPGGGHATMAGSPGSTTIQPGALQGGGVPNPGPHTAGSHNAGAHNAGSNNGTSPMGAPHVSASTAATQSLLALMSPRVLFSVCLGLGTTGVLLHPLLPEPLLFAAAVAGGILFERLIVTPIWNFTLRFASSPALTLESALLGDATAVTKFDANGQGIIAIEVDGQMVQLLGTLQSDDRAMGAKVPAGARLRVAEVDAARNRCTVSLY